MMFARPKVAPMTVALLGLLAFAVLAVRFAPNWLPFARLVQESRAQAASPEAALAAERAIFEGPSVNRGYHVLRQARDLGAEIAEPNHKIVRWRLLMPAAGRWLHLPGWAVLGLAHAGGVVLIVLLVAIAARRVAGDRPAYEPLCLGLVAGASAPFFSSMGLLGYYDAWLAVALLAVAFVERRWVVLLACVLAPWIDERFVLGFPLALCVRRVVEPDAGVSRGQWLRREALWPSALVVAYAFVRLSLGGSSGSQTAAQYLREFVFSGALTAAQRAFGLWQGLGPGWLLVGVALVVVWRGRATGGRALEAGLLVAGTVITCAVGALTALDTARSMVLLAPLVPLGWLLAGELAWWRSARAPLLLAAAAVLLPAWHCLGDHFQPVDRLWAGAWPEAQAHNNLGSLFVVTPGRQDDAAAHYAAALRIKPRYPEAHNNLGVVLARTPGQREQALARYTEALRLKPDYAEAHYNLANLFAVTPGRQASAIAHYGEALRLRPGYMEAHVTLAVMLANAGRPDDAQTHYAAALRLKPDFGEVHNNLALLLARRPDQREAALRHFAEAARLLPANAGVQLNYARHLEIFPGRQADARRHYARALELNPDLAEARAALARLGPP